MISDEADESGLHYRHEWYSCDFRNCSASCCCLYRQRGGQKKGLCASVVDGHCVDGSDDHDDRGYALHGGCLEYHRRFVGGGAAAVDIHGHGAADVSDGLGEDGGDFCCELTKNGILSSLNHHQTASRNLEYETTYLGLRSLAWLAFVSAGGDRWLWSP